MQNQCVCAQPSIFAGPGRFHAHKTYIQIICGHKYKNNICVDVTLNCFVTLLCYVSSHLISSIDSVTHSHRLWLPFHLLSVCLFLSLLEFHFRKIANLITTTKKGRKDRTNYLLRWKYHVKWMNETSGTWKVFQTDSMAYGRIGLLVRVSVV